mmetsp:Transcript_10335/g.20340  ORF Transcript_10335/g.20340 Transcript_10335/m.20340 type:complete len:233 (+) Transcript_10335:228-926(+)
MRARKSMLNFKIASLGFENHNGVVAGARGYALSVTTPINREDGAIVDLVQDLIACPDTLVVTPPDPDSAILAAGCNLSSLWVHAKAPDCVCVTIQNIYAAPIFNLFCPYSCSIIIRCRDQNRFRRMPLYKLHILRVSREHRDTLTVHILFRQDCLRRRRRWSLPNPNALVTAACCNHRSIRAPRNRFHLIFMTLQSSNTFPLLNRISRSVSFSATTSLPYHGGRVETRRRKV